MNTTKNNTFGIVTACDEKYFPGALALIKSINCNSPLPVTVINQGMTANQLEILKDLGTNIVNIVRCINIDDERFGCCYVLFDIDNAPYDYILYLDADMIVLDDLSHMKDLIDEHGMLWTVSNPAKLLSNKHHKSKIKNMIKRIKNPKEFYQAYKSDYSGIKGFVRKRESSLNSGILGIKKELMHEIKKGITKYSPFLDKFNFPDQDLLSLIRLDLNIKGYQLGYEYNACRLHGHPELSVDKTLFSKIEKISKVSFRNHHLYLSTQHSVKGTAADNLKIKVLHYNNSEKPWFESNILKPGFKEIWEHYYNL